MPFLAPTLTVIPSALITISSVLKSMSNYVKYFQSTPRTPYQVSKGHLQYPTLPNNPNITPSSVHHSFSGSGFTVLAYYKVT